MSATRDRETVLELFVDDRVTADDEGAGLVNFVLPTAQDLGEHAQRKRVRWKADDVERSERLTAHGIDVGEGIRRCDLAKGVWIIDDRREEVDGLHEREVVGQHEDPRVIEGLATDDQVGIGPVRERRERSRQVTRTQFGGSTSATRECR